MSDFQLMTDIPEAGHVAKTAVFSPCRKYRYELWRLWDSTKPYCMFIGLNPSTADETQDDPTVRRCIAFAKAWGYGALCMTNIFAWRDTDPLAMKAAAEPVGPDNNRTLAMLAYFAGVVVAAWGKHGSHMNRADEVMKIVKQLSALRVNKDGSPAHPLYLPASLKPMPYSFPFMRYSDFELEGLGKLLEIRAT